MAWVRGWRGKRGCVDGVGQLLVWVAWVAWVHKLLVWVTWVAWVEILAWVVWVHKILAWAAWVKILACLAWLAWVKKPEWVNVLLLYNCTSRIHQALQHTYFISCIFKPNETCRWCIFRFIFKFVLPRLFLKFRLSLLLHMQKQ